jgi:hypothetical protein
MLLGEVKDDLGKLDIDAVIRQVLPQPVKDVIVGLGKAVNMLLKSQENLTSVLVDVVKVKESQTPAMIAKESGEVKVKTRPIPAKVVGQCKVRQAIREAEKKTIIFNLNMGKVPVMNKETIQEGYSRAW